VERALRPPEEAQVHPQPRGLDQDGQRLAGQEPRVAAHVGVLGHRERHVSVDVVLGGARGVVRGRLLAVDRAPREQRPLLGQFPGPAPGRGQHPDPEPQRVAGDLGVGVRQERHQVDLGVPEVVALIARAGHALHPDAAAVAAGRGLGQLEQAPPDGLLDLRLAGQLHVGVGPEVGQPLTLLGLEGVQAGGAGRVQGLLRLGQQVVHLAGAGVVSDRLDDQHRLAGFDGRGVDLLAQVGHHPGIGRHRVLGEQVVVHRDPQRQVRGRGAVAEQHPALVLGVHVRQQHPVVEAARLPRVEPLLALLGGLGDVLPVADGGGDHDLGGGVHAHREAHHRQGAAGERDHPGGVHDHGLAARGPPRQAAPQDPISEIQGAAELRQVGLGQAERLTVHADQQALGVGHVDDRLPRPGESERLLGVMDRPRLVEAVEEGAVAVGVGVPLLVIAAEAEVAVPDGEHSLDRAPVRPVVTGFADSPLLHRHPGAVDGICGSVGHGSNSSRSATTRSAPSSIRVCAPTPRSTPTTRPNAPARPAWTPETASSNTTARSFGTPSASAA